MLDHVGGLADVTLPAADVRADPRLRQLRARLERRPAATRVAILTPADIASLKPGLVVRSRADFADAIRRAALWFFAAFCDGAPAAPLAWSAGRSTACSLSC